MIASPSVNSCKDKIIKYSKHSIIYYAGDMVYKQYPLNQYRWVNEVGIVNYLNLTPNNHIIKFINCEIIDDYVIDVKNKELCLDKKEKVLRLSMNKYDATLDILKNFTDCEVFFIINNLLASLLFCKSKNIMHRDIKEKNIFINFKNNSPTTRRKQNKKRHISELVLADFNISKYKYTINTKHRCDIMTSTHRSPEIWKSMSLKKHIEYDERVDVWSFCIVLSYLLTNHSFYDFLNESYLKIDPSIVSSAAKMKIAMNHFIKIYSRKKLVHIDFFKKIMNMGIKSYTSRCTFNTIQAEMLSYTHDLNDIVISPKMTYSNLKMSSPEIQCNRLFLSNSQWVRRFHDTLSNNNTVLSTFYKNITYTCRNSTNVNQYIMLALYLLISYTMNDNYKHIDFYIQKIKHMSSREYDLLSDTTETFGYDITIHAIQKSVINLLRINNYNILY